MTPSFILWLLLLTNNCGVYQGASIDVTKSRNKDELYKEERTETKNINVDDIQPDAIFETGAVTTPDSNIEIETEDFNESTTYVPDSKTKSKKKRKSRRKSKIAEEEDTLDVINTTSKDGKVSLTVEIQIDDTEASTPTTETPPITTIPTKLQYKKKKSKQTTTETDIETTTILESTNSKRKSKSKSKRKKYESTTEINIPSTTIKIEDKSTTTSFPITTQTDSELELTSDLDYTPTESFSDSNKVSIKDILEGKKAPIPEEDQKGIHVIQNWLKQKEAVGSEEAPKKISSSEIEEIAQTVYEEVLGNPKIDRMQSGKKILADKDSEEVLENDYPEEKQKTLLHLADLFKEIEDLKSFQNKSSNESNLDKAIDEVFYSYKDENNWNPIVLAPRNENKKHNVTKIVEAKGSSIIDKALEKNNVKHEGENISKDSIAPKINLEQRINSNSKSNEDYSNLSKTASNSSEEEFMKIYPLEQTTEFPQEETTEINSTIIIENEEITVATKNTSFVDLSKELLEKTTEWIPIIYTMEENIAESTINIVESTTEDKNVFLNLTTNEEMYEITTDYFPNLNNSNQEETEYMNPENSTSSSFNSNPDFYLSQNFSTNISDIDLTERIPPHTYSIENVTVPKLEDNNEQTTLSEFEEAVSFNNITKLENELFKDLDEKEIPGTFNENDILTKNEEKKLETTTSKIFSSTTQIKEINFDKDYKFESDVGEDEISEKSKENLANILNETISLEKEYEEILKILNISSSSSKTLITPDFETNDEISENPNILTNPYYEYTEKTMIFSTETELPSTTLTKTETILNVETGMSENIQKVSLNNQSESLLQSRETEDSHKIKPSLFLNSSTTQSSIDLSTLSGVSVTNESNSEEFLSIAKLQNSSNAESTTKVVSTEIITLDDDNTSALIIEDSIIPTTEFTKESEDNRSLNNGDEVIATFSSSTSIPESESSYSKSEEENNFENGDEVMATFNNFTTKNDFDIEDSFSIEEIPTPTTIVHVSNGNIKINSTSDSPNQNRIFTLITSEETSRDIDKSTDFSLNTSNDTSTESEDSSISTSKSFSLNTPKHLDQISSESASISDNDENIVNERNDEEINSEKMFKHLINEDTIKEIDSNGNDYSDTYDDSQISEDSLDEISNFNDEISSTENILGVIQNENGDKCLQANLSIRIMFNESKILVPSDAYILGNCSDAEQHVKITWKSNGPQNNSFYFIVERGDGNSFIEFAELRWYNEKTKETLLSEAQIEDMNIDDDSMRLKDISFPNGLSIEFLNTDLDFLKRSDKPGLLEELDTFVLQIASGSLCLIVVIIAISIYSYRKLRSKTRIFKVSLDK